MNNFYLEESYYKKVKKNKRDIVINIFILVIGLALFFGLSFLVNDSIKFVMYVISSIILAITLIVFFYRLIEIIIPNKRHNKFEYHLLTSNRYEGYIYVNNVSNIKVINKGINVYEISGVNDEGKSVLYYFESLNDFSFKASCYYKVVISQNYILEVEESRHD